MLTPQEVSGKGFPKASFGTGGYNMAAVDEFLDTLTDDYTSLYKENATLKGKLKVLAEKVEEYRATEDAMRSTLLTAQRMAAKLVQEAETEKAQILTEAQEEATRQIAQLDEEKRQAEKRLAMAQEALRAFYQQTLGNGFAYAYRYPGMQKVVQAAGRLIRSETDAGVVLLVDDRYQEQAYRALLPDQYAPQTVRSAGEIARRSQEFWRLYGINEGNMSSGG